MQATSRHFIQHSFVIVVAVMITEASFADPPNPLPDYKKKPDTWVSKLIDKDKKGIKDEEFASFVKTANTAAATAGKSFTLICTFTQCFGGGFLTELENAPVVSFGANSASRYFQPCSYDELNERSYYAHAWQHFAPNLPLDTDEDISKRAYDGIKTGAGVPANPNFKVENAQFARGTAGAPPEVLKANANHNYVILWAGLPGPFDLEDVNELYAMLIAAPYNYAPGDIYILYGDFAGAAPPGVAWTSNAKATKANLQNAFEGATGFLQTKLANQANATAQVFFWAGDHGSVDLPISMCVDPTSTGLAGSEVAARVAAGKPVQSMVYCGGGGTNKEGWEVSFPPPAPPPPPPAIEIDAISFNSKVLRELFQNSPPPVNIYFSVSRDSVGLADSGVAAELAIAAPAGMAGGYAACTDVFVATAGSNRQAIDGLDSLGLNEPAGILAVNPPLTDNLSALALVDMCDIAAGPIGAMLPTRPLFFSVAGANGAIIYVFDPKLSKVYPWLTFPAGPPAPPTEVDALVAADDRARPGVAMPGEAFPRLSFNGAVDRIMFSVKRMDAFDPFAGVGLPPSAPCDLWLFPDVGSPTPPYLRYKTCGEIGLKAPPVAPMPDDVDGLDILDPQAGLLRIGDINGDGLVDFTDVLDFVRVLLGLDVDPDHIEASDINDDGAADGDDIKHMIRIYLRS